MKGHKVLAAAACIAAASAAFPLFADDEGQAEFRVTSGAIPFIFNKIGDWTVALTFADGTTKTAIVTIERVGFMILVR